LWRESHLSSINEKPVAKATLIAGVQGPEGPCSLRQGGMGANGTPSPGTVKRP
jgi:hypothetical protein